MSVYRQASLSAAEVSATGSPDLLSIWRFDLDNSRNRFHYDAGVESHGLSGLPNQKITL